MVEKSVLGVGDSLIADGVVVLDCGSKLFRGFKVKIISLEPKVLIRVLETTPAAALNSEAAQMGEEGEEKGKYVILEVDLLRFSKIKPQVSS